jgi:hypothetical protein
MLQSSIGAHTRRQEVRLGVDEKVCGDSRDRVVEKEESG